MQDWEATMANKRKGKRHRQTLYGEHGEPLGHFEPTHHGSGRWRTVGVVLAAAAAISVVFWVSSPGGKRWINGVTTPSTTGQLN